MYLLIQVRVVFHSSVVPAIPHVDYGDLLLMTKIKQHYYSGNRENITDFHNLNMVSNTSLIPNRYILGIFSNLETYAAKIVKIQCQKLLLFKENSH